MSEWNSAAAVAALDRLAGTAREVLSLNVFGDTQDVRKRLEAFESDLRRSLRLAAQEVARLEGVVKTQRDRAADTISRSEARRLREKVALLEQRDKVHSDCLAEIIAERDNAEQEARSLIVERDRLNDELCKVQSYLHGSVFRVVVDQLDRLRKRGLWHLEGMMA